MDYQNVAINAHQLIPETFCILIPFGFALSFTSPIHIIRLFWRNNTSILHLQN